MGTSSECTVGDCKSDEAPIVGIASRWEVLPNVVVASFEVGVNIWVGALMVDGGRDDGFGVDCGTDVATGIVLEI